MSQITRITTKLNKIYISFLRLLPAITNRTHTGRKIKWWLIYGAERTGTSLMCKLVGTASLRIVSDWGLGNMLKLTPEYSYITFDRARALRDISDNILDNAGVGNGAKLDLVFKQANIDVDEYQMLVKMWGKPTRKIFCMREPTGYIASAATKFPEAPLSHLQSRYVVSFETFEKLGGDIFEYSEILTTQDYIDFLSPLVSKKRVEEFLFRGTYEPKNVSDEMWRAFNQFKQRYQPEIFPQ
jgi:hypothetical protein